MADPFDMSGRVVIVTGGSRGLGRGLTAGFLERGADVVICGRREPESPVAAAGREALFVAADVRRPDDVQAVVDAATGRYGRLDVLVNNAGGSPPADTATASPNFSRAIIELNLLAPLVFSQAANAVMQAQEGGGSIVNIGSLSGVRPSPHTAAYGAAKAGLLNLTETMAQEFAPKVRVNALVLGYVRTEQADLFYGDEEGIAAVGATLPMGRMAEASDVGDLCAFLVSPLASYLTGASIAVHGGGEQPPYLRAASGTREP
ncbi:MAG: SDR family oxidoreductase [Acidimicrobiia bacterium]|nr:SDR family oxidoreductase [Acidimicrobiia bacterium]